LLRFHSSTVIRHSSIDEILIFCLKSLVNGRLIVFASTTVNTTLCERKRHPRADMLALAGKGAIRTIGIMRVVVTYARLVASTTSSTFLLASVDAELADYAWILGRGGNESRGGAVLFLCPSQVIDGSFFHGLRRVDSKRLVTIPRTVS
jgi:hypothetical protein